jgi:hypothetical protein
LPNNLSLPCTLPFPLTPSCSPNLTSLRQPLTSPSLFLHPFPRRCGFPTSPRIISLSSCKPPAPLHRQVRGATPAHPRPPGHALLLHGAAGGGRGRPSLHTSGSRSRWCGRRLTRLRYHSSGPCPRRGTAPWSPLGTHRRPQVPLRPRPLIRVLGYYVPPNSECDARGVLWAANVVIEVTVVLTQQASG